MMDGNGLSVADALALSRDNNCNDGDMWGGNGAWMMMFLFFLLAWGGRGFGIGNNGSGGYDGGALTRGELCQDMNFQSVENGVRGIQQGLCDGFYAMNTSMLNGFAGVDQALCNGFNNVNNNITQARFDAQQCCCETNRNIDSVKNQLSQCCCDIINASNANTQRIVDHLTQNEIQTLRDNLQTANFQLSQQTQSANLINQLRPCPVPAYLSCSPYEVYNPFGGYGRASFGRGFGGCDCNSGCGC
uniref:SXP/RAL-2 family protein Ani s 5-like cation-binding domain-containing protein n=1 Tax=Dulem virus 36 TaxID=3145754 RepID=A0AAU8B0E9_9CAUD